MKLITFFLTLCLLVSTSSFAAKPTTVQKPRVVLMPIKVSEEDRSLSGSMETALVEGLQERYIVFSGERVQQKTREIFAKESKIAKAECDETKCMEDIAIAFQAELIAVANVTRRDGGYFLAINIQNIFDNKVIYTKSLAYENQSTFQVINKLKELTGAQGVEPIKEKPTKPTTANNGNSTLEVGCTGADIGAEVWINDKLRGECPVGLKVPEGTLQLKVIKHIDAEHEALLEQEVRIFPDTVKKMDVKLQSRLTAEGIRMIAVREEQAKIKASNAKGVWIDKETGLMWQDNEDVKTVRKDWQEAMDYCQNLTLADYDDWKIPNVDDLKALFPKKTSLKNVDEGGFFARDPGASHWALSPNKNTPMTVSFRGGGASDGIEYRRIHLYIRCVRDNK